MPNRRLTINCGSRFDSVLINVYYSGGSKTYKNTIVRGLFTQS